MTNPLPVNFLSRVSRIIAPFTVQRDDREALIDEAFFLYDPIAHNVELEGKPRVFRTRLIKQLVGHGCMPTGEHSVARLLTTVKPDCGTDKHAEIETLMQIANVQCADASAPASTSPSPAAPPVTTPPQTIDTPRDERQPTVFISYSHDDAEMAQRLIKDLNAAGHACWIDTSDIKGGDEWILTIAEGIINSYAFVPLVTAKALRSKWVQDEILWAKNRNKRIIPFILEDVLDAPRFFPLVSYQGVTVFESDYETSLTALLSYLQNPNLPDVTVDEDDDTAGDETSEAAPVETSRRIPRKLELAYMERLRLEELLNTEKYTAMGGVSQRKPQMRSVFQLLPMNDDGRATQEPRRFENAVTEIQRIRRCVLLGDPGGGKTTTLWKLAADLVDTALADRRAPLPLLIRLGKWTDPAQSLPDFIASQLGDLGAYLDTLLSDKRAALLLDGLNELPASQHDDKYPQVQEFIKQHRDLLAVVSCRELDYTLDLGFDKITITPLDPLRIREFVQRYLGDEQGEALFWRIAGGDDVHQTWQTWQKAGATLDLFFSADEIPRGEPDVYGTTSGAEDTIWREKVRGKHTMMELARNPYMLLMLTSVYADEGELPDNRGQLFAKFVETLLEREEISDDEQPSLVDGLAQVAYEMQVRRADSDTGNALTVLPEDEVEALLGERRLYLAGSASILSVGEQVRFTHQLLQEYFAATYMDNEIRAGRLQASDIWQPENWWERTNWEEAAVLLAGLYSDDPTPIVKWLQDAQPEIAAQSITRSGASAPPRQTLLTLRDRWIPRLTDIENDPQPEARAAVGRALGQLTLDELPLDNRPGVSVVVRDGVRLPDLEWVTIPAGEFTYQDTTMTLDYDFKIARYPVTYAQFQTFLDDSRGAADDCWWQGLPEESEPFFGSGYPTRDIAEQRFQYVNHPRETVNWYQMIAFCRWLSWRMGGGYDLDDVTAWAVRLPTEYEWEKAARSNTGWQYPYGEEFDADKGNTDETGLSQTSAVGIFPHGDTPHWRKSISDLSGNVFEWCLTDYENSQPDAARENIRSAARRVLRGGSWVSDHGFARAASRLNYRPGDRDCRYGLRVVCPPGGDDTASPLQD